MALNVKHSEVIEKEEKHLPRGMEVPTKGSIPAGNGSDIVKVEGSATDGTLLVTESTETSGLKWFENFTLKNILNVIVSTFRDSTLGLDLFKISSDKSTYESIIQTGNNSSEEKLDLAVRASRNISLRWLYNRFFKNSVFGKEELSNESEYGTSGENTIDVYGKKRHTAIDETYGDYSSVSGFIDELVYCLNDDWSSFKSIAELICSDSTGSYYAGWAEITMSASDEVLADKGFTKELISIAVVDGVISATSVTSDTNGISPVIQAVVSTNKITFNAKVEDGEQSYVIVGIKVAISVGSPSISWNLRLV